MNATLTATNRDWQGIAYRLYDAYKEVGNTVQTISRHNGITADFYRAGETSIRGQQSGPRLLRLTVTQADEFIEARSDALGLCGWRWTAHQFDADPVGCIGRFLKLARLHQPEHE